MNYKIFLIFLFCFSFLIRALVFGFFLSKNRNYWNYDTKDYHSVATQIVDGNGVTNLNGTPFFYRVPGYSFFLAACYKLFGVDLKTSLWVQIFFASFIPLLVFWLSLVLFSGNILLAKICGLYSAVHLGFVLFSGLAMTESFFLLFFLLYFILLIKKQSLFQLFLSGTFLGIASLLRPVGQYFIVLSILFLLFSSFNFWQNLKKIFLLFIGWLVIVGGWLLRNYLLTGYIFFLTLSGPHFFKHSAVRLATEIYNCSYTKASEKLSGELNELIIDKKQELNRDLHEIEECILAEKLSINYLKKDPFIGFKHCLTNMFKTCFSLYSAEILYIDSGGSLPSYEKERSWWSIFKRFLLPKVTNKFLIPLIYLEIILFLFILIGFFGFIFNSFFRKENFYLLLKLFPFLGLFIFLSLACGFARLRLPIEPILIILSFKFWLTKLKREKRVS
jgi:4-amino-4-deoxy-L-arabinose transferase-like glycosyltransferase